MHIYTPSNAFPVKFKNIFVVFRNATYFIGHAGGCGICVR